MRMILICLAIVLCTIRLMAETVLVGGAAEYIGSQMNKKLTATRGVFCKSSRA